MTGKEISRAKPDPQIFLLAASRLNVKPKDGLIFEDAVSGIQAAIKESMSVIGIGTTGNLKGPLLRIKVFSNQNQRKIEQVIGTFFN
jgi:beta-phosphoglucomutase